MQEDLDLTAFLLLHIDAVLSSNPEPRPTCFHCGSVQVGIGRYRNALSGHRIPRFLCRTCNWEFTRLHGTPLYNRRLQKVDALLRLLSLPISCASAAEMLRTGSVQISDWVRELRSWLLELDPTGQWEALVRLGGLTTAITPAKWHFEEGGEREDRELTRRLQLQAVRDRHQAS